MSEFMSNSVSSLTDSSIVSLRKYNESTLSLCHGALRRNASSRTFMQNGMADPARNLVDRVIEQLDNLYKLTPKSDEESYGYVVPRLLLRSDEEKRFISTLNHYISAIQNKKNPFYCTLLVKYNDGSTGKWERGKVNTIGGTLTSENPLKLHGLLSMILKSNKQEGKISIPSPLILSKKSLKAVSNENIAMNFSSTSTDMLKSVTTTEQLKEFATSITGYAEALKIKEESLKIRQSTLLSIYKSSPSIEVEELIEDCNAKALALGKEEDELKSLLIELEDFAFEWFHDAKLIRADLSDAEEIIDELELLDGKVNNFIIESKKVSHISKKSITEPSGYQHGLSR